ncbi:MAG: hypothetical protein CH6_1157 [Candidatus Kapaibacterium sp.]|jgi:hypothetical protein|nr:MAG: hypothetical protein CH6_1157 [Candidatus Kapabacteria bacterium]ROL55950.1 MAG: DUF2703 domain-containing protein [Bacteroidetes/Chlorobi group bacterium Naka2016]
MKIRPKNNCCSGSSNFVDVGAFSIPSKKTLEIRWTRLVVDEKTCPRCGNTETELMKAYETLKQSLSSLKIEVVLKKSEISLEEFKRNPLVSNQIWINGKLLEDWLNLSAGKSPCCDVCGPNDCRTIEINGKSLEVIPAELIVKASLFALKDIL